MNNPRRKRSGYQGIVSIRRKRRGIYPKRLNSITLAFKEINYNSCSFSCPFYIDVPICTASFKDPTICDHNPYLMLKIQNGDQHCNFIAGLILLGLDKRINIEDV